MSTRYSARQRVFFFLILFISLYLIIKLSLGIFELIKSKERVVEAENQVEKLRQEQQQLSEQLETYQSSTFIEREIRDKLGLAKPGEIIVILPDDLPIATNSAQTKPPPPDLPNWRKWAQLFGF